MLIDGSRFNYQCSLEPEELAEAVADGKVVKGKVYHDIEEFATKEKYVNGRHVESFQVNSDDE
jgi:hypothetical protein